MRIGSTLKKLKYTIANKGYPVYIIVTSISMYDPVHYKEQSPLSATTNISERIIFKVASNDGHYQSSPNSNTKNKDRHTHKIPNSIINMTAIEVYTNLQLIKQDTISLSKTRSGGTCRRHCRCYIEACIQQIST